MINYECFYSHNIFIIFAVKINNNGIFFNKSLNINYL